MTASRLKSRIGYSPVAEEPGTDSFGTSPSDQIRLYWRAVRPPFLVASVLPVLVGTVWGATQAGSLNLFSALLAALCMALGHGAGNLINDVEDDSTGNDSGNSERIYPYSGGSRLLQNGVMNRQTMGEFALILLLVTALPGLLLLIRHGFGMLVFAALLLALPALFLLPPPRLGYRGFGAPLIALSFGVVPVMMASWLQTGGVSWLSFLVSLPVALWAANALLVTEIPDREADARAEKRTFVVRFGIERTRALHKILSATAFAACFLLMLLGHLSVWGLIGAAVLLGLGLRSANTIDPGNRNRLTAAIRITLGVHVLGCLWLAGWITLS